jgi:hypothetical protein
MALNPFFLQGSDSEQNLIQQLINEQLKIFGVEVSYLPQKFIRKETILREVTASKFDDNFSIEAYVSNYDGYTGSGDILSKFGMNLKDELTLIISKERFEDFISPFLLEMDPDEIIVSSRPREGDLIYFPLGKRLFEIKFVEHEQPFYQLGKTYVYEIKCELFEYSDNIGGWNNVNTTVEEIDRTLEDQGYITTLKLFSIGSQATANTTVTSGYVRKIELIEDGYNYKTIPIVAISTAPPGGTNAEAVAITSCIGNSCSIKEILLVNPGSGYTQTPNISIISSSGIGATARAIIEKNYSGISSVNIINGGSGYVSSPSIIFSSPNYGPGIGITAIAKTYVNSQGEINKVLIVDAGVGYGENPSITITNPPLLTGISTFIFNEVVTGETSGSKSRVKSWDSSTNTLKVGVVSGKFIPGEIIVGSISSARYSLKSYEIPDLYDKYEQNDEIQQESDLIVDFSESNLFGNY